MVFQMEAQFQQFVHCKFRENIIRMLYIPTLEHGNVFLVVNKFGKVGLYHPEKFTLVHTYMLDLSAPMHPNMNKSLVQIARRSLVEVPPPKCQRTHLVVDACFAQDAKSLTIITTKGILQWYDIGEIETHNIGLELFPRKQFMNLKKGESPAPLKNKGHIETHRVFGLREGPTCMEYYTAATSKVGETSAENNVSKLLIGDADGCVTVILIEDPRKPLGVTKIRGVKHEIKAMDLVSRGQLMVYKAHNEAVREIRFSRRRQLIISCSRDKKFSLFLKDFKETVDPYIISLPKGVNCFAYSENIRVIATGSSDQIIRLFNQFVVKMPQMELLGHRSSVVAVKFLSVSFSENPLLLSLSEDVELRAWNPNDFTCLQSIHISFPVNATIQCKTPEFARRTLYVFQPHYNIQAKIKQTAKTPSSEEHDASTKDTPKKGTDGEIIVLYCNSFARLDIEKDPSSWPFDFEDFAEDFQTITSKLDKKLQWRHTSISKDPKLIRLSKEELEELGNNLDCAVKDVLQIKNDVDKKLGLLGGAGHGLSVRIADKLHAMEKRRGSEALSKKEFVKRGSIFRSYPIYDIPPLQFARDFGDGEGTGLRLPVTTSMKEAGINEITCVEDLLTKTARKYFAETNLRRKCREDEFYRPSSLEEKHLRLKYEEEDVHSSSEYEESDRNPNPLNECKKIGEYEEYLEESLRKLTEFQAESQEPR